MIFRSLILCAVFALQGLSSLAIAQVCDLAPVWRQRNWSQPNGSCAHASTISAMRWVQMFSEATDWKRSYGGGENFDHHVSLFRNKQVAYALTRDGDVGLLEYAIQNRRMVIVYWPDWHVTNLIGRVDDGRRRWAVILDNNHPSRYDYYDWDTWVRSWRRCSGCAIVVLMGSVPPSVPAPAG